MTSTLAEELMSNTAIMARIRDELAAFERKERSADQLEIALAGHFEALEGVPYEKLKRLHEFEARIVTAEGAPTGFSFETVESVLVELRSVLDGIEKEANQSSQPTPLKRRG